MFWGAVLAVLGLALLIPATRAWRHAVALRRHGRAVVGEVADVDMHGYYSFRITRPVVRYELDGVRHRTTVGNFNGKAPLRSRMELRVDPHDPTRVVAALGNAAAALVVIYVIVCAVGVLICVAAAF